MTLRDDKQITYRVWAAHAAHTGRPRAARKLRFIMAHREWRAAHEALRLVNGNRRLQGVAMGSINRNAAALRRAYRDVREVR